MIDNENGAEGNRMTENKIMEPGEDCTRCGDTGYDRRTLSVACFYDLGELNIPWQTPKPPAGQPYRVRFCKDCRADFIGALAEWFAKKPDRSSPGTGIFVRRNGANVEISEEEWYRDNPGREPVRA